MRLRIKVGEARPADYDVGINQTVEDFLTQTFASEIAGGRRIRLIYNGGVLEGDATFAQLRIPENAILICSITSERIETPVFQIDRFGGWFNLWVLFGSILACIWSVYFAVDGWYFSTQTLGLLALMTGGLILWIALTVVPATGTNTRQNQNPNPHH